MIYTDWRVGDGDWNVRICWHLWDYKSILYTENLNSYPHEAKGYILWNFYHNDNMFKIAWINFFYVLLIARYVSDWNNIWIVAETFYSAGKYWYSST